MNSPFLVWMLYLDREVTTENTKSATNSFTTPSPMQRTFPQTHLPANHYVRSFEPHSPILAPILLFLRTATRATLHRHTDTSHMTCKLFIPCAYSCSTEQRELPFQSPSHSTLSHPRARLVGRTSLAASLARRSSFKACQRRCHRCRGATSLQIVATRRTTSDRRHAHTIIVWIRAATPSGAVPAHLSHCSDLNTCDARETVLESTSVLTTPTALLLRRPI